MKCHWCNRETKNKPEPRTNGFFETVEVPFCDRCKGAQKESDEITEQWLKSTGQLKEISWPDK